MLKRAFLTLAVLFLGCFLAAGSVAAERPLDRDDITLLLIGGATSEKLVALIQQRGVNFEMSAGLAKKFRELGASEAVIEALQKAGNREKVPAARASQSVPGGGEPSSASRSSLPEEAADQPASAEAVGRPPAPAFSVVDVSGQRLTLSDYKGKVVVLNFWATWCSRCRVAIPQLVQLQDRYRDQGLQVIGLSVEEDSLPVREFSKQQRLNYPVAMSDRRLREAYGGIPGVPMTFLIGRDGRIYAERIGVPQDGNVIAYLEPEIKTLLAAPAPRDMRQTATVKQAPASPEKAVSGSAVAPAAPQSGTEQAPATAPEAPPTMTSASASPAKPAKVPTLPEPSPPEIERIIQEFTAKEKLFKEARNNYTYHQINKVHELDADGNITGTFQQEWDILFDDRGGRIERVTYAPLDTLKRLGITQEDLNSMRNIQPFVLTSDELPEYDVKYLGHVRLDELTTYVFSIRPQELKKGRIYFQGTVWVDDRDLQIVKSEGKTVPEQRPKKGQENLFPRFATYREQVDGKYWFPTFTMADDTLYFSAGPVRVRQTIRYTDYKQYKATTRIIAVAPEEKNPSDSKAPPPKPK